MPMIATKAEMYTALLGGRLGNTMPNFLTLADWQKSEWADAFPMWGVRSGIAGGDKRMRLNVPTADVAALYRLWFGESGGNISPMVDEWVTLRAELCESDTEPVGLHLRYPTQVVPQNPWRGSFERHSRNVYGTEAWRVLTSTSTPIHWTIYKSCWPNTPATRWNYPRATDAWGPSPTATR